MSIISFDTAQFGSGFPVHLPESIDDLDAQQRGILKQIIDTAWEQAEHPEASAFSLLFHNGDYVMGSLPTMTMYVEEMFLEAISDVSRLDFNGDGIVDQLDLDLLVDAATHMPQGSWYPSLFDINGDGVICDMDIAHFNLLLEETTP